MFMMDSSSAESSLLDEARAILLICCGKTSFAADGIAVTLAGTVNASAMNDEMIISVTEMRQLRVKRGDNIMMLLASFTENESWKWKEGGSSLCGQISPLAPRQENCAPRITNQAIFGYKRGSKCSIYDNKYLILG